MNGHTFQRGNYAFVLERLERVQFVPIASSSPPWREHVDDVRLVQDGDGIMVIVRHKRIATDRPARWLEVIHVDTRRVVLRSLRPVHVVRALLQPGKRLALASRSSVKCNANAASNQRWWL